MDTAQYILLLAIFALSALLVILGIQVFFILRNLRKTLIRVNKILDNINSITENVANSASVFSSLATLVKTGSHLISLFKGKEVTPYKNLERAAYNLAKTPAGNSKVHANNDIVGNGLNSKKPQRRFFRGIIKKVKPTSFL